MNKEETMTQSHETPSKEPPDTLPALLDAIDAWQNGGPIEYGPEGLAILLRLQQARIGSTGLSHTVEVTV